MQEKAANYFIINEDDDSKLDFNYQPPKTKLHREQKGVKGMVYMFISALFFSLMAFVLKLLYNHSDVNTYEVTYWMSIMMGLLNYALFKAYSQDHLKVPENMRTTLILRSVYAFFGTTGFYLALEYTDLSKATALYWTNPMMTAVLSYFWIHEHLNFVDWLAIFISFFGILVIQNPWAGIHMADVVGSSKAVVDNMGCLAAIGGAIFFAIAQMQTRKLGKKVHFLVPPFYQAIFSAFIAPLIMFIMLRYRSEMTTRYGWYELVMIIVISLSTFMA